MGEVSVLYLSEGVSFSLVTPRLPWHLLALLLGDIMKILIFMKSMMTTIIVALVVYFYSGGFSNGWVWMGNYS